MQAALSVVVFQYFYAGICGNQHDLNIQLMKSYYVGLPLPIPNLASWDIFKMIFPGTLWCGPGDIAKDEHELGWHTELDRCCRTHDFCEEVIEAGGSEYSLNNTGRFTRLHCDCDEIFRKCLHKTKSVSGDVIGHIYFNKMGFKCFKKEYPVTGCLKKKGWFITKCVKHSYNKNAKKIYQWFDVKFYNNNDENDHDHIF